MGLLPEVSADFEVTESVAGYLISGYALSVAIGAILLTAAVTRFERKKVLLSLMVLFIIGNLMSALAPSYEVMMGGRIVAALCTVRSSESARWLPPTWSRPTSAPAPSR